MGVMTLMCTCYTCGRTFLCSPTKVPSAPANLTTTGTKEPVCEHCVNRANPERIRNGLPPIEILPGAYEGDDE